MGDLRQKLRSFITDNFLFGRVDSELSDDDSLVENGIVDSTGVLMLVAFLEQDLGLRIEDDEIVPENLDSINRLNTFVARKREQSNNDNSQSEPPESQPEIMRLGDSEDPKAVLAQS